VLPSSTCSRLMVPMRLRSPRSFDGGSCHMNRCPGRRGMTQQSVSVGRGGDRLVFPIDIKLSSIPHVVLSSYLPDYLNRTLIQRSNSNQTLLLPWGPSTQSLVRTQTTAFVAPAARGPRVGVRDAAEGAGRHRRLAFVKGRAGQVRQGMQGSEGQRVQRGRGGLTWARQPAHGIFQYHLFFGGCICITY
jgi:hypothetical protein